MRTKVIHKHEIVVSNIGTVFNGSLEIVAGETFYEYIKMSKAGFGRGGDEVVTWFKDGDIYKEYQPMIKTLNFNASISGRSNQNLAEQLKVIVKELENGEISGSIWNITEKPIERE